MPTLTAVALDNFLHHGAHDSQKNPLHENGEADAKNGGPRHLYIMPALYSTPHQAPLPENATPHSPSPYVVNHKRRGGRNEGSAVPELDKGDVLGLENEQTEVVGVDFFDEDFVRNEDGDFFVRGALELPCDEARGKDDDDDDDAASLSTKEIDTRSYVSAQGEFFDAIDEFSFDGSSSNADSCDSRIASELHASRLRLLEEIDRRKAAEESVVLMHCQWERMKSLMAEAGLTVPAFPSGGGMQSEDNLADRISQEMLIATFVAEAVGRGQARAEAEEAAAKAIELKDQEILRLRDRLQYYETVNHELSQRNLVEVARRQQERKRSRSRRRRWVWGLVGLSVAIGASVAASVYNIPQVSKSPSNDFVAKSAHD
ncbi:uncharacterized protein LOC127260387 [Andrographis paniculata]|uniref:uncharacterized protein LOC127260387 n=1 Tax=Andrographis paniculata TaxID=175694 RepID=UPI0021E751EA|nr:uncharacterized protein LOC127260387 [Andrographis paniculata]